LESLELIVQTLLKFDPLSSKIERDFRESELRANSLRDSIKTAKLKLSLSEMEYKEFVNAAKRRSQKQEQER
jgi:hypothetical protein